MVECSDKVKRERRKEKVCRGGSISSVLGGRLQRVKLNIVQDSYEVNVPFTGISSVYCPDSPLLWRYQNSLFNWHGEPKKAVSPPAGCLLDSPVSVILGRNYRAYSHAEITDVLCQYLKLVYKSFCRYFGQFEPATIVHQFELIAIQVFISLSGKPRRPGGQCRGKRPCLHTWLIFRQNRHMFCSFLWHFGHLLLHAKCF